MIARLRVLLPFSLFISIEEEIKQFKFKYEDYEIIVYPPFQANVNLEFLNITSSSSVSKVIDQLKPVSSPIICENIKINEQSSIETNLLQIDFCKSDFDRQSIPVSDNPFIDFAFQVLNDILTRTKTVIQDGKIKPMTTQSCQWKINYLDDEEEELPRDPKLIRRQFSSQLTFNIATLTQNTWEQIRKLPFEYEQLIHNDLLLDAESSLPDMQSAILLASAGLEVLIGYALNVLVKESSMPDFTWKWISDRDNDSRKQPSVAEEYDVLLKTFSDKSLKDEPELWKAFKSLRQVRNSLIHEGKMIIKEKNSQRNVTMEDVRGFIGSCKKITEFVENLLPPKHCCPKNKEPIKIEFTKILLDSKNSNIGQSENS